MPGVHQIRRGQPAVGWLLLGSFFAMLTIAISMGGTGMGGAFLGLLFALHVGATIDATFRSFDDLRTRFLYTAAVAVMMGLAIYWPTIWAIGQYVTSLRIVEPNRYFDAGDVLFYNRSSTIRVGDIVVYELPTTARIQVGPVVYEVAGTRINRMVAVAGQQVQTQGGKLMVDGVVSPWQPISKTYSLNKPFEVPSGSVFILPDDLVRNNGQILDSRAMDALAVVQRRNVHGKIVLRTFPWSRFQTF